MTNQTFYTNKAPQITIESCHGDLDIRSWADTTAVMVKGDDYLVQETEAGLTITSQGDLRLMLPSASSLAVQEAQGDLLIKNVAGDVVLQAAHGDVVLSGLSFAKVGEIHADLSAQNIDGSLSISEIHGDASCRSISQLSIDSIHGDLSASYIVGNVTVSELMGDGSFRTINGDLHIASGHRDVNLRNLGGKNSVQQIQGDIRLVGGLSADKHQLQAEGDIIVRWPLDAPLNVTAKGGSISNRLPLKNLQDGETGLTGQLGDGETYLMLETNGSIILKDVQMIDEKWEQHKEHEFEFDFIAELEGLGERIAQQLNDQMSRITADFELRFGPDFSQKMAEKVAKKAEQAAAKAEAAAEKIARRVEQAAAKAERAAQREVHRQTRRERRSAPSAAKAEPAAPKPDSTEEKLKILKMVENGTITAAEAEMLLRALDG